MAESGKTTERTVELVKIYSIWYVYFRRAEFATKTRSGVSRIHKSQHRIGWTRRDNCTTSTAVTESAATSAVIVRNNR